MKKSLIVIGVVVILFLAGLSLFPRKVSFQATLPVCTQEGITSTAECDFVLWKWWYQSDKLQGTVTVDGITFEHMEYETDCASCAFWFAVPHNDLLERVSNSLNVYLYGKGFEALSFAYSKDGENKWYFGPAESVEEVKKIIDKYLK